VDLATFENNDPLTEHSSKITRKSGQQSMPIILLQANVKLQAIFGNKIL
jgi:hypothetical protein